MFHVDWNTQISGWKMQHSDNTLATCTWNMCNILTSGSTFATSTWKFRTLFLNIWKARLKHAPKHCRRNIQRTVKHREGTACHRPRASSHVPRRLRSCSWHAAAYACLAAGPVRHRLEHLWPPLRTAACSRLTAISKLSRLSRASVVCPLLHGSNGPHPDAHRGAPPLTRATGVDQHHMLDPWPPCPNPCAP
jgi:hypothetical protein